MITSPCMGQVREDAGIHSLAHAPVGAEGSSVSTDKDSEIDIEGALFVDEEEDGSSLDGAPEQGRHAAKRGVRATIAAAAAGALDNSDSDYHPPGKLGDDCSPRRSLRSGRGRPAQAFSGPTKVCARRQKVFCRAGQAGVARCARVRAQAVLAAGCSRIAKSLEDEEQRQFKAAHRLMCELGEWIASEGE